MPKGRILLYESVIDHVKSRIADGTYRPGERLPSFSELAQEIGIGISTVREGIRVLGNLGLVRVHQGQGIFVTEDARLAENPLEALALAEDASLLAILEARIIFEPELAALAAERATPDQVQAILNAAREQERQVRRGGDSIPAEYGFHRLLADATHNPVLKRMVQSIDDLLLDNRRRTAKVIGTFEKAVHFHYLIGLAIEQKNPQQARTLMQEHILDVKRDVEGYVQSIESIRREVASDQGD
jgi:GntR family transcriptional regulator, transcriptional repressor for pyruvate dehydrogenase complex